MNIHLLTFLFLISLTAQSQQYVYDDKHMRETIREGLDKSYNFEFEEAEKLYAEVKKKYPDNPAYNLLMSMNSYWKMFYFNNYNEKSKEYINYLENALQQTEKLDLKSKDHPETIFFFLAIHSSFALYHVQNKENLKAIGSAKKTYDYIRDGYPLKEKYAELNFSAGIYDFYREQYPETHPVYKTVLWMFAPGSKQKGLGELELASKTAVFTQTEAEYYLTLILLKYQGQPEAALHHAEALVKKYPRNFNFIMKYTECLVLSGKYGEAERYAYTLNKSGHQIFEMASFVFYGMTYEKFRKKPEQAKAYYLKALKLATEIDFPVNDYTGFAYAGLARIADSKGEKNKARQYYGKAQQNSDYNSVREESAKYLEH